MNSFIFQLFFLILFLVKLRSTSGSPSVSFSSEDDVDKKCLYLKKLATTKTPGPLAEDELFFFHDIREEDIGHYKIFFRDLEHDSAGISLENAAYHGHFNTFKLILDLRPDINESHVITALVGLFHFDIFTYIFIKRPPNIDPFMLAHQFNIIEQYYLDEFKHFLSISEASTIGVCLVASTQQQSATLFKMILESEAEIGDSYINDAFESIASSWFRESRLKMMTLLTESQYMNKIYDQTFKKTVIYTLRSGCCELANIILKFRPKAISDQIACETLINVSTSRYSDTTALLLDRFNIDASSKRQALLIACSQYNNCTHDVSNLLIEKMDPEDVEIVRRLRIDAIRQIDLDNDMNGVDRKRIGINHYVHSLKNYWFGSLITCLFNTAPFRNGLYASDLQNEPSLRLAETFAQLQRGNQSICIDSFFLYFLNKHHGKWSGDTILHFADDLFNALTEQIKKIFQVSLRVVTDNNGISSQSQSFKDVTTNFIRISCQYDSISDAIASKFFLNAQDNNLQPKGQDDFNSTTTTTTTNSAESDSSLLGKRKRSREANNQIEILNHPEVLMFAIIESDERKTMKLDSKITITSTSTNGNGKTEEHTYFLQAFSYKHTRYLGYQMSNVREFYTDDQADDRWFTYGFSTNVYHCPVENGNHFTDLFESPNTTLSFAFYLRSDKIPKRNIPIKSHILDELFDYYLKILLG